MNEIYTKTYFDLPICASTELHQWIDAHDSIIHQELTKTLKTLHLTTWQDQEHILAYLHYMYMYRCTLPVLEAVVGRERLVEKPQLAQFQLLSCLLGRFLDDLIDQDSGFWNKEQALFWFSHFLLRCEKLKETLFFDRTFDDKWIRSIHASISINPRLYRCDESTERIYKSESCPMPLKRYLERVPYFLCLPEELCEDAESLDWVRSYISALLFLYDIDDSINDIMQNVATEPAYEVLVGGLDTEGRFKVRLAKQEKIYNKLLCQARELLIICRDRGRTLGFELGPAVIDAILYEFDIKG